MKVRIKTIAFNAIENGNGTFTLTDQNGGMAFVTAAQLEAQYEEVTDKAQGDVQALAQHAGALAESINALAARIEKIEADLKNSHATLMEYFEQELKKVKTLADALAHHALDPSATSMFEVKSAQ